MKPSNRKMSVPFCTSSSGWLRSILVCRFDLNVGQLCEWECDTATPLSEAEKKLCALLAFPDTHLFAHKRHYESCFSFRVRAGNHDTKPSGDNIEIKLKDKDGRGAIKGEQQPEQNNYLVAASFFRQEPDPSSARGASQKAVVVVTNHDGGEFACLLKQICYVIGPLFFEHGGEKILETAWALVNSEWPDLGELFSSSTSAVVNARDGLRRDAGEAVDQDHDSRIIPRSDSIILNTPEQSLQRTSTGRTASTEGSSRTLSPASPTCRNYAEQQVKTRKSMAMEEHERPEELPAPAPEVVTFSSALLGNSAKKTLELRLFSAILRITLIPNELEVRHIACAMRPPPAAPAALRSPSKSAAAPASAAAASILPPSPSALLSKISNFFSEEGSERENATSRSLSKSSASRSRTGSKEAQPAVASSGGGARTAITPVGTSGSEKPQSVAGAGGAASGSYQFLPALSSAFDAGVLRFRNWVFPKWAVLCAATTSSPDRNAGASGVAATSASSSYDLRFFRGLLLASSTSSPQSVQKTSVIHASLVNETGAASTHFLEGSEMKYAADSEVQLPEDDQVQVLRKSKTYPYSGSTTTAAPAAAQQNQKSGGVGEQVSPRKHSVLYGSDRSPNLRALSINLDKQSYDGAARNLWTRLGEYGPEMLWTLWELALTGESIVIFGSGGAGAPCSAALSEVPFVPGGGPTHLQSSLTEVDGCARPTASGSELGGDAARRTSSSTNTSRSTDNLSTDDSVYAYLQLIKPLEYNARHFNPSFTVYDPDFKLVCGRSTASSTSSSSATSATSSSAASSPSASSSGAGFALGCANPAIFADLTRTGSKASSLILSTDRSQTKDGATRGSVSTGVSRPADVDSAAPARGNGGPLGASPFAPGNGGGIGIQVIPQNFAQPKIICSGSCLYTEHAGCVPPDDGLLSRLLPPSSHSAVMINNFLLCQYFYELTCTFLRPFLPYLVSNVDTLLNANGVASSGSGNLPQQGRGSTSESEGVLGGGRGKTMSVQSTGSTPSTGGVFNVGDNLFAGDLSPPNCSPEASNVSSPVAASSKAASNRPRFEISSAGSSTASSARKAFSPANRSAGASQSAGKTEALAVDTRTSAGVAAATSSNPSSSGKSIDHLPGAVLKSNMTLDDEIENAQPSQSHRQRQGTKAVGSASSASAQSKKNYATHEFVLSDRSREDLETFLRTTTSSRSEQRTAPASASPGAVSAAGATKKKVTLLPAFVSQEFLSRNLKPEGVFATLPKEKVRKLYTKFLKSPHFEPWFRKQRDTVVQQSLALLHSRRRKRVSMAATS